MADPMHASQAPRSLRVQPITAAAFAPYGVLIEPMTGQGRLINQGSSQRFDFAAGLDLVQAGGAPCLALFRAQAQEPHGPWHTLERHRLGSQTFLPCTGAHCIALVGLGAAAPEPDGLAAFLVGPQQGFCLHPGTWHHGLLALEAGDFWVLERQAHAPDCEWAELAQAVHLVLPQASL